MFLALVAASSVSPVRLPLAANSFADPLRSSISSEVENQKSQIENRPGATPQPMWAPKGVADTPDSFVAFRGSFAESTGTVSFRIVGASEYLVWLDGKLVHDGPARFARAYPEYQTVTISAAAGTHLLAVQTRNDGVTTRILSAMPPFLWCGVSDGKADVSVRWRCARMPGYQAQTHRISDILGWIDWCDTRALWPNWLQPAFDDRGWQEPVDVDPGIGAIRPCKVAPVHIEPIELKSMASGLFATAFGYEADEPAARFFLDDLAPKGVPAQGVWRRYDLGRVRLGRPNLTLDCAAGTIVEFALCEQLRHGRVDAWIPLSGSVTCNFDHFVARGGPQTFTPFTPKGGRYLEVHVKSPGPVRFLGEEFLERSSFGEPKGTFVCGDALLNRIWKTGVDTVRACADDALVDCPTRERGEWTGDVASVATDIAAVAYGDLSLSRRALVQASQVARSDGLVAGVGPGDPGYLSTYAAQWTTACVHYWELTGDKSLLTELYPAARRNMRAFETHLHDGGLDGGLGWGFVDWGYVANDGPSDMALNLHYFNALNAMVRWDAAVEDQHSADQDRLVLKRVGDIVRHWIQGQIARRGGWKNVSYHRASLALFAGLVDADKTHACIQMIERHLLSCFPNNPNGPRLADPGVENAQIMTPYFAHWALAALMEHGKADFVLSQYRKCWGWALEGGDATWMEVFDPRWSHCHEWSGCPTWQLSRYVLGIRPRFDLGPARFEFHPVACGIQSASGTVPFGNGGILKVEWRKVDGKFQARFKSNQPVDVRYDKDQVESRDSRPQLQGLVTKPGARAFSR